MLFSTPILDLASVSNNHERGQDSGGGGGGGGTLLYKPYTYLPPQRVWFIGHFGCLKTLCPFWFGIAYGFQGTFGSVHVRMYLSFSGFQ